MYFEFQKLFWIPNYIAVVFHPSPMCLDGEQGWVPRHILDKSVSNMSNRSVGVLPW